eukprot:PhF_6_TR37613/c0_g1_i2/m.55893
MVFALTTRNIILIAVAFVCMFSFGSLFIMSRSTLPPQTGRPKIKVPPRSPTAVRIETAPPSPETPEEAAPTVPTVASPSDTDESSVVSGPSDGEAPLKMLPNGVNGAANRAPGISSDPLLDKPSEPVSISNSDIVCYDLRGDPTNIPPWTPNVLSHTEAAYEKFENALKNEWTVLVVWSPSLFMGPQPKVCCDSQGRMMEPPTRGRNPQYYWNEYNATWHVQFEVNKLPYTAQVMHKNSLAVCIRERLHMYHYRCGTNKDRVVPIYHCVCRHCRETSLGKTKAAGIQGVIPKQVYKPKVPVVKPIARNNTCVLGISAPWLFPSVSILPKQPYEGLHRNLEKLLASVADANNVVLVYIFNKFWVDHLHNCIYSMVHTTGITNYIIATMDSDSDVLCRKNRLPCFDATEYAVFEEDMVVGGQGYSKGSTRKVSEGMSWIKPRLAVAILKLGYGFFMVDLDMTWFKNPMNDVWKHSEDVVHQCDTPNLFSVNSGFYLAKPTLSAITFFEHLMVFRPEENADQTAMKLFFRYDHTHGASHVCLNKWLYNMKCNYKIEGTMKKEKTKYAVQTFNWHPQDKDRAKMNWFILHATCLSGAVAKMLYLRTNNAWLLDDLDKSTSKEYCVDLKGFKEVRADNNVVLKGLNGKTQHSASYTTVTEPYFLQERH